MKRLYLLVAWSTLFLLNSCQSLTDDLIVSEKECVESKIIESEQNSYYVLFEEALDKAREILGEGNKHSRSSQIRKVKEHFEYIVPQMASRSNSEEKEIRFHVINFEDNAGFALISADSRTTAVYAYGESGNLNIDEATENTGFGIFIDSAAEYYKQEIANYELASLTPTLPPGTDPIYGDIPFLATEEIDGVLYHVRYVDYHTISNVNPLVTVNWAQYNPYNYYCPSILDAYDNCDGRASAGCGPVAAAQIMSYFQSPSSIGSYTFNWENIMQFSSYYGYSTASLATANLIRAVGEYSDATYGKNTSTNIGDMANTFIQMGYNYSGVSGFNDLNVINSLDNHYLVYIRGERSSDKGHAWLIDGYNYEKKETTYYYTYTPYAIYRIDRDYRIYYHCNWGWGGFYNAWTLDTFVVPNPESHSYGSNLKMIYNIRPNNL